jgi:phosphoribosylformimino-5-aminoimidazole carboxamide ribotide isomerase
MDIIPSVDIKNGQCVKLIQGKLGTGLKVSVNPLEVAVSWEAEGAKRLHIIDLDAAITGSKQNRVVIQRIVEKLEIPVEVGGGIRSMDYLNFLLKAGAQWVILGTAVVEQPNFVFKIAESVSPDRIIIAVDSKQGSVLAEGWTKDTGKTTQSLLRNFENMGISAFLYTDVEVEGTLRGIQIRDIERLVQVTKIPIIYAGGISSIQDLLNLTKAGVNGAVIGMAFYSGKFTFQEAMEAVKIAKRES